MDISIVNVSPQQAVTIRDHCSAAELSKKYHELFGELSEMMKKQSLFYKPSPFGIYHNFSQEDVDVEAGIPCAGVAKPEGRMNVIQTYSGKAVCLKFIGPYEKLQSAWDAVMKHVTENKMEIVSSPFEVYVTDPGTEPDSSKWQTDIYVPVK